MPLDSDGPKQGERNADWMVFVNAAVEVEA